MYVCVYIYIYIYIHIHIHAYKHILTCTHVSYHAVLLLSEGDRMIMAIAYAKESGDCSMIHAGVVGC